MTGAFLPNDGASPLHEPTPRLRRSAVVVGGVLVVGLGLVSYYSDWSWLPFPALPALNLTTLPAAEQGPRLPDTFRQDPTRYEGIAVASASVPPATEPSKPPMTHTLPTFSLPVPPTPPPMTGAAVRDTKGVTGTQVKTTQVQAATPAKAAEPVKKPRWEYLAKAEGTATGASVAPGLLPLQGGLGPTTTRPGDPGNRGALIKPAGWEIPASPLQTVYRSQVLLGELLNPLHSDLPGQLLIRLTIPVFDKFGYDQVIFPKDSLIVAVQSGQPQHGNTRLKVTLEQIELPSGEIIPLRATIDDQDGSSGLSGKVNNHYGKLLLATGISALLNIGVKSAAGTPGTQQFFRNPVQDAAQDIGQGVQQEAEKAVSRELRVPPTITRKAGTFCTIHLQENIQFNRPPVVVR